MAPVMSQIVLNAMDDPDCVSFTTERKHFKVPGHDYEDTWVKRNLRPSEWQTKPGTGTPVVPEYSLQRMEHEALALKYLARRTEIPVPMVHTDFQDNGARIIVMEAIQGVSMADLPAAEQDIVALELDRYVAALQTLKDSFWGGLSTQGVAILPPAIMAKLPAREEWKMKEREAEDLVFCHLDLTPHNIIVDPATLKVEAILGWGYSGFYPAEFERRYYRRTWPAFASEEEESDAHLVQMMLENVEEHAHQEPDEEMVLIKSEPEEEDVLQDVAAHIPELTPEELALIKAEPEDH